jgi:RNA polymerase sigma factor for flagellar operon FliA
MTHTTTTVSETDLPQGPAGLAHKHPNEDELVRLALPIIQRGARRMWRRLGRRIELDELVSLGLSVALQAARRYDPSKARFPPYLIQRFNWSLMSEMRKHARRRLDVSRGIPSCASQRYADVQPRAVCCAKGDGHSHSASLFERCSGETTAGMVCAASDVANLAMCQGDNPEQAVVKQHRALLVRAALAKLPSRARTLLERHYFRGERFDEVAADMGISKYAASRLHKSAVRAMAKQLEQQGLGDE